MNYTRRFSSRRRRRQLRVSSAMLALVAVLGAGIISSHSAVGEAPASLESYRKEKVDLADYAGQGQGETQGVGLVPMVAEAELGAGPVIAGPAPGESATVTVDSSGRTRSAILSVPSSYYPGEPTPVLLAYPGYLQTASDMQKFAALDSLPALVVYMQGVGKAWEGAPYSMTSDGEDIRFTQDILAALNSTYNVDRSRIYVAGMSNGGGFTAKLACRIPGTFAAIASVSGAYYAGTGGDCQNPSTSFLEIHGAKDETIAYDGGFRHGAFYQSARQRVEAVAARNGCSPDPVTTALAGDVRRVQWPTCRGGRDVVHLRVEDGGHSWPGDATGTSSGAENKANKAASDTAEATSYSLDATTEVWAFVSAHQLAAD